MRSTVINSRRPFYSPHLWHYRQTMSLFSDYERHPMMLMNGKLSNKRTLQPNTVRSFNTKYHHLTYFQLTNHLCTTKNISSNRNCSWDPEKSLFCTTVNKLWCGKIHKLPTKATYAYPFMNSNLHRLSCQSHIRSSILLRLPP